MFEALNEQYATDPAIVIGISWGSTPTYYATKRIDNAGRYCKGIIKSVGQISNLKRADNSGSTGSVDVEFYDVDGQFKAVIDTTKMEGTKATVFQHFEGLTYVDWFPLLHGRITNPQWSEGERVFSCTIEACVISDEIGYAAIPTDFPDLSKEAYGVPWPLLFGEVIMSPCVHVRRRAEGFLKTNILLKSAVFVLIDNNRNFRWVKPEEIQVHSYFEGTTAVTNKLYITGGENFPQGQEVKLEVDGVIFKGIFDGEEFTVSASNLPRYENIKLGARSTTDPDKDSYYVAWLPETEPVPNLVNCYVYFAGSSEHNNFVVKQDRNKIWFKNITYNPSSFTKFKLGSATIIKSVYRIEPSGLRPNLSKAIRFYFKLFEIRRLAITPAPTGSSGLIKALIDDAKTLANNFWGAEAGVKVRLYSDDDPDIYVMSLVQLSEVKAVYGKKKIKLGTHDYTSFVPIPKGYYTEQLVSNYNVSGQRASALIFRKPLTDYNTETEKWEEVVYVSAVSTVGPNTANIIKWILQNYTDYKIHEQSFETVAGQLTYPSNFGIYERKDSLEICREIAWQARCGLLVDSDEIGIVFLATEPNAIGTFSENNIQFKSVMLNTTGNTDLVTRLVGTWRDTMEWSEPPSRVLNSNRGAEIRDIIRAVKESERKETPATNFVKWEENIDKYGLKVNTVDIYIYNTEEPVQKCIDFWGHIGANVWRTAEFSTVLLALPLQIFDAEFIALDILGPVKSILHELRYDTKEKDVHLKFWLPVKAGTNTVDHTVWNAS